MFDKIIGDAIRKARIDPVRFDIEIRKAGFKSRFDWFIRGAADSLRDAYNARVQAERAQ